MAPMGIATTRIDDRVLAAVGAGGNATPEFEAHDGICNGGILFLLPALIAQGLFKPNEIYQIPQTHYYGLNSILLTLAMMALARIKNPEQLKQCKPGEIGRIIGLDRIPEVRCLREKINLLCEQNHAQELNNKLIDYWYPEVADGEQEASFFFIDGHQRIYSGGLANLPSKFISRLKLCHCATTEYWVNDQKGMPVMSVTGELTEKLQQAIEEQIIPQMQKTVLLAAPQPEPQIEGGQNISATVPLQVKTDDQQSGQQELPPACTFIFDREGYDVPFFNRLWDKYRIAFLTYRKNVKDLWPEESFKTVDVTVSERIVSMNICEQKVMLGGTQFREVRRLTDSGHQTSIITNNGNITTAQAAGHMFSRWCQENFFRYMKADYDFDKIIEFGTETIDETKQVVNPQYSKLSHRLKKEREKTRRLKADFLTRTEQGFDTGLEQTPQLEQKLVELTEKIEKQQQTQSQIEEQRKQVKSRVTLKEMPEQTRYNKLKPESKLLMNIIKMICYRAETAIANLLAEYGIKEEEKRMVVKQIIQNNADLLPDMQNNTLTITLHTLSAPRFNKAAEQLAAFLNSTDETFPDTKLRLIFKTTAS
jgi:hypothetical protein